MRERIKLLRKLLNLNQTDFGNKIGVKQSTITGYETGIREPLDSVILSICREFNVNENWLRTGEGEMFHQLPEDDEVAIYVSDLLEETNPFYDLILDIMKSYQKLDPTSKEVIHQMSENLVEISKKRKK